jgi:hypothetical protein
VLSGRSMRRVEHWSRGIVRSVVDCTSEASPIRDRQATEIIKEALQYYDSQMKGNILDKKGRTTEEMKVRIL